MALNVQMVQARRPIWATVGIVIALVLVGRFVALGVPDDRPNPLAITIHLYAVLLAAGVTWLAAAVGQRGLRLLGLSVADPLERWVFSLGLGFGVTAYAVLGLGLTGVLHPAVLAGVLAVLTYLVRHEVILAGRAATAFVGSLLALRREIRQRAGIISLLVPLVELLLAAVLLLALAPPTGYDALMYHLQGPKRFLELGRIAMLPDVQQANMPLTVDLLYLVGLAFASDEMPNVLHLTLALLVAVAIYGFGRQFVDERVGLFGAVIFLSSPILAMYGPMANIDFGFAMFDFLAVWAFFRWVQGSERRYLLLAGLLAGFSMGSKYHGGITGLMLGLALLGVAVKQYGVTRPLPILSLALTFAIPAALVACPWYIKNLLWLGSPIWPLLSPGPTAYNIAISANVDSGRTAIDYLLLPIRAYIGKAHEYPIARPPFLLLLLPAYLLMRKHRVVSGVLAIGAVHLTIWAQGPQVLRYLTQALPELSIGAAYVLVQLAPRLAIRPGRSFADALLVVGLGASTAAALAIVIFNPPFAQLLGAESREAYLVRQVPNHTLVAELNKQGDAVDGVLLIGDRRAFYVNARSWSDVSLEALEALGTASSADEARGYLRSLGVSHVLVSAPDVGWHYQYDPENRIAGWWDGFERSRNE